MPQELSCPKCEYVFAVTEARHPVGVQCPGCAAELTAEFRRVPVPTPGESPYELVVSVGRPAGSATPGSGKKPLPLDDDEGSGKGGGGSMAMVVLAGLTALAVTLGGLGVTGYYLFTNMDVPETSSSTYSSPRNNNPFGGGNPKVNPKGGGIPGGGIPGGGNPIPPPPKDVFDLRPAAANAPPITAPAIAADGATIELGGKAGAVAVGGGGKYLIMHIPDRGELKLFDASKGDVTATVNGVDTTSDIKLAAGVSRAFLYVPSTGVLRVYSLPTLRHEFDTGAPMTGATSIAMGSRTNGPMLMVGNGEVVLVDVSGQVREVEGSRGRPAVNAQHARATPDGTAFAMFSVVRSTQTVRLLTVVNRKWNVTELGRMMPFPGPDGNFYGYGAAVDRTGSVRVSPPAANWTWLVPSATADASFLKVVPANTGTAAKPKRTITVTAHRATNPNAPLAGAPTLTGLPEFEGFAVGTGLKTNLVFDEHLFFIPEAKMLATITNDRTKLVVRQVM
jgi:hypothetical protein